MAKLPVADVLERVEAVATPAGRPDAVEAAALLGTVPEPRITVARALEFYWELARATTLGKSPDRLRRWENPRRKAVRNFIAVVGSGDLASLTRDDMRDVRQH